MIALKSSGGVRGTVVLLCCALLCCALCCALLCCVLLKAGDVFTKKTRLRNV